MKLPLFWDPTTYVIFGREGICLQFSIYSSYIQGSIGLLLNFVKYKY